MLTLFRRFMLYWRPVVQNVAEWVAKGLALFGIFKLAVPNKDETTFIQAILFLGSFFAWTWGVFKLGIGNHRWWVKGVIWVFGGIIIGLFTKLITWNWKLSEDTNPEVSENKWWEFWKEPDEKDPANRGGAQGTW